MRSESLANLFMLAIQSIFQNVSESYFPFRRLEIPLSSKSVLFVLECFVEEQFKRPTWFGRFHFPLLMFDEALTQVMRKADVQLSVSQASQNVGVVHEFLIVTQAAMNHSPPLGFMARHEPTSLSDVAELQKESVFLPQTAGLVHGGEGGIRTLETV